MIDVGSNECKNIHLKPTYQQQRPHKEKTQVFNTPQVQLYMFRTPMVWMLLYKVTMQPHMPESYIGKSGQWTFVVDLSLTWDLILIYTLIQETIGITFITDRANIYIIAYFFTFTEALSESQTQNHLPKNLYILTLS